jgi:hypothetical protein
MLLSSLSASRLTGRLGYRTHAGIQSWKTDAGCGTGIRAECRLSGPSRFLIEVGRVVGNRIVATPNMPTVSNEKTTCRPSETVKDVMEKQQAFINYLQRQREELSDRLVTLSRRLETSEMTIS